PQNVALEVDHRPPRVAWLDLRRKYPDAAVDERIVVYVTTRCGRALLDHRSGGRLRAAAGIADYRPLSASLASAGLQYRRADLRRPENGDVPFRVEEDHRRWHASRTARVLGHLGVGCSGDDVCVGDQIAGRYRIGAPADLAAAPPPLDPVHGSLGRCHAGSFH